MDNAISTETVAEAHVIAQNTQRLSYPHLSILGRLAILYSALIAFVTILQLLSPPPAANVSVCGQTVHLGRRFSFTINCDSPELIDYAISPRLLLTPGSGRQDRPLFVAIAALPTQVLIACKFWRLVPAKMYIALGGARGFRAHYDKHHVPIIWSLYPKYVLCAYMSYLFFNCLLLLVALLLFHWVAIERLELNAIVIAFAALLVNNDVVKAFFWTPHPQMFNILVPIGGVFLCERFFLRSARNSWRIFYIGILAGTLGLAYGSFAIWIIGGVSALALDEKPLQSWRNAAALVQRIAILVLGFALPTLGWIVACELLVGSYRNGEIAKYHQFVWIMESARLGYRQLFFSLESNWFNFIRTLLPVIRFPFALLALVVALGLVLNVPVRSIVNERTNTFKAITIMTISSFAFFYLDGFYEERLTFNMVPPLILGAAILAIGIKEKTTTLSSWTILTGAWTVAIARMILEVTKSGPYD